MYVICKRKIFRRGRRTTTNERISLIVTSDERAQMLVLLIFSSLLVITYLVSSRSFIRLLPSAMWFPVTLPVGETTVIFVFFNGKTVDKVDIRWRKWMIRDMSTTSRQIRDVSGVREGKRRVPRILLRKSAKTFMYGRADQVNQSNRRLRDNR